MTLGHSLVASERSSSSKVSFKMINGAPAISSHWALRNAFLKIRSYQRSWKAGVKTTANGLELVFAHSPGDTRNSTEATIVKM